MKAITLLLTLQATVFAMACTVGATSPKNIEPAEEIGLCWDEGAKFGNFGCEKSKQQIVKYDLLGGQIIILAEEPVYEVTKRAADVWNDDLGFDLLEVHKLTSEAEAQGPAHMLIAWGGDDLFVAGSTMFINVYRPKGKTTGTLRGGRDYQAFIRLFNNKKAVDVMVHEIGHALGLDHDESDTRSVMYPNTSWRLPRIQEKDLEMIRRRYKAEHYDQMRPQR